MDYYQYLLIENQSEYEEQPSKFGGKSLLIITLLLNVIPFVLVSSLSEHLKTEHMFYIYFAAAHVFAYTLPLLLCTKIGSYYVIECHIALP